MTIGVTKAGIDLGIVTRDLKALVCFYRDVVGLEDLGSARTRSTAGGKVHTLRCGESTIKLIEYAEAPAASPARGPVYAATGYRYWTITIDNLEETVAACVAAGRDVVVPSKEIGQGIRVAIVEDPDGTGSSS